MLTNKTQAAIYILHEIGNSSSSSYLGREGRGTCNSKCRAILDQLKAAGIISLLPEANPNLFQSYKLCKDLSKISLFQVLLAIGEGINLMPPSADEERIYKHYHYGTGASRLGVINQMLRTLLGEVSLLDI